MAEKRTKTPTTVTKSKAKAPKKETVGKPKELVYPVSEAEQSQKQELASWSEKRKLPSGPQLLWATLKMLSRDWEIFGGILLIYALLTAIFVGGVGSTDISTIKTGLTKGFHGHTGVFNVGLSLFSVIIGADKTDVSTAAGAYQMMLFVVISLAIIWTLRQRYAKNPVRIRDSFYLGMYPLVPFVTVLFIMGLQLIPFVIGGILYGDVVGGGIAVNAFERIAMGVVFFLLAAVSVYMLCTSVFALYIATLPEATPKQSLDSARELVRYRRWIVLKKLLFLLMVIFVGGAIIIIPIALVLTPVATIMFFALSILALAIAHGYLYALYRELL